MKKKGKKKIRTDITTFTNPTIKVKIQNKKYKGYLKRNDSLKIVDTANSWKIISNGGKKVTIYQ